MKKHTAGPVRFRFDIPLLVFLTAFALSLRAMAPTVVAGDSGELILAAWSLGVPHPPGYPVFALLGRIFTCIPCGDVAFRVNLSCAFISSCTAMMLCHLLGTFGLSRLTALLAALAAFTAPVIFAQGLSAEVYALAGLLTVLFIWSCSERPGAGPVRCGRWLAGWLFLGLGLACHYWFALLAPLILIFSGKKTFRSGKNVVLAASVLGIGLSVFLVLPVRSLSNPEANWSRPATARALWNVVSRGQYGVSWSPNRSFPRTLGQLWILARESGHHGRFILIVLLVFGLADRSIRRRDRWLLGLGILFSGVGMVLVVNYGRSEAALSAIKPFMVPYLLLLYGGAGLGFERVIRSISGHADAPPTLWKTRIVITAAVTAVVCWTGAAVSSGSRRFDQVAYHFSENILKTAGTEATIFLTDHDDNYFPLWSVARTKPRWRKMNPGIVCTRMLCLKWYIEELVRLFPEIEFPPLPRSVRSVDLNRRLRTAALVEKNSAAFTFYLVSSSDPGLPGEFTLHPRGIGYTVSRTRESEWAPVESEWRDYNLGHRAVPLRAVALPERRILSYYGLGHLNTAARLEKRGIASDDHYEGEQNLRLAAEYMTRAERFSPFFENKILVPYYVRRGNLNVRLKDYLQAADCFKKALSLDPENENIQTVLTNLQQRLNHK